MTDGIEARAVDPYALYRYFDVRDTLLYVGISGELARRDKSHIASSKWMQFTARSTVERHGTIRGVGKAEREAIETERPIFNKQHNNTPEARERLRTYLEGIGRLDLLPVPRAVRKKTPMPDEAARHVLKCVDSGGFRPWVPGFVGFPEAHDWCEPGACLGRLEGSMDEIRRQVAAAVNRRRDAREVSP